MLHSRKLYNVPTHTSEATIPINGSEKGDESGVKVHLTNDQYRPAQLDSTDSTGKASKSAEKSKAKKKEKKRRKRRARKKNQEMQRQITRANEEENRSNNLKSKLTETLLLISKRQQIRRGRQRGTYVDIDQPTSFTREFKEIISPSTSSSNSEVSQNAAASGEESEQCEKSRLPAQSNR